MVLKRRQLILVRDRGVAYKVGAVAHSDAKIDNLFPCGMPMDYAGVIRLVASVK
jgi:hypothetical protein